MRPCCAHRRPRRRLEEQLFDPAIDLTVVTAAIDEKLNEKGHIVPGLGGRRRPPLPKPSTENAATDLHEGPPRGP